MSTPLRGVLRKKKSVTFHPSTKASPSAPSTPNVDDGAWATTTASVQEDTTTDHDAPTRRQTRSSTRLQPPRSSSFEKPSKLLPTSETTLRLLDYSNLPAWQRDNSHILSGYRPLSGSHMASLPSLFYLHNESINIWTHLAGLLVLLPFGTYWLLHVLPTYYPAHSPGDTTAFLAFFAGTGTCLAASAAFHLFGNVGPFEARAWNGVDYAGIVACIWGSFWGCLHWGFPEDYKHVRRRYELMITVLAVICTTVSVLPQFRTPRWRPFRAGMFVAMGLSAVLPVLHGLHIFGVDRLEAQMSLSWVVLQGALYVVGAGLYVARVPERFRPGRFDVYGASHQIFHVLVLLAAGSHLVGLIKAFRYAYSIDRV